MVPNKKAELDAKMCKAAMLLGQGQTVKETAQAVGRHEDTVSSWKRRPDFQALCMEECNKWLAELKPQALMFLKTQMEAEDRKLGVSAANYLLRYALHMEGMGGGQVVVNFTGGMPEPKMPGEGDGMGEE